MNITCAECGGSGVVELAGVLAVTLELVREHGPKSGSELARIVGVKAPAMNGRLKRLAELGLVSSRNDGRKVIWKFPNEGVSDGT